MESHPHSLTYGLEIHTDEISDARRFRFGVSGVEFVDISCIRVASQSGHIQQLLRLPFHDACVFSLHGMQAAGLLSRGSSINKRSCNERKSIY